MKRNNKILIIIVIIAIIAIALFVANNVLNSHPADITAINIMQNSSDNVKDIKIDQGILLDGNGNNTALIFYPGAGIDYKAYIPLLTMLAQNGIDIFLVDMPHNLPILDSDVAGDIMRNYNYSHWYMGGHSMGGSIASSYIAEHPENIDGLILLASYPIKNLNNTNISVLSIYGSNDGVINFENYEKI